MKNINKFKKVRIANFGTKIGGKVYEDFPHIASGFRNIYIWMPKKSKYIYYREFLDSPRHRMFKERFKELGYLDENNQFKNFFIIN